MALEKKIQDILDRMPKIQSFQHAFFSEEVHNYARCDTFKIRDEFGAKVKVNYIGGCSIDSKGNIVPDIDEGSAVAPLDSYKYLGYVDPKDAILVHSDHSPEIPKYHVEIPLQSVEL